MKSEEITALAREYAEEMIKGRPSEKLPNRLKNSMLTMNTEYVAEVFQWLLRRYCLVEKKAVAECYSYAVNHLNEMKDLGSTVEDRIYNEGELNGKIALLESFFPDLGKEVEP